jgi:hypothetical protein
MNIKNTLIKIIILSFLVTTPGIVRAQYTGLEDLWADIGGFIADKLQSFDSAKNVVKTFGLDKVAYAVGQKASEKMTQTIINKINGGASGDQDQNYITNFKQHFADIGTKEFNDFTTELRSSNNPFASAVERNLIDVRSGNTPSGLNNFTLDKILPAGTRWEDAANDLSVAGSQGLAFYSQLGLPQNTPMGASMIAQEELANRVTNAKKISEIELIAPGFIGTRDSGSCAAGTSTSSRGLEIQIERLRDDFARATTQAQKDQIQSEINSLQTQITAFENGEKFSVNIDLNCAIKTPGNVVGSLANIALEEPIMRNRMADDFVKIVANSLTQITSTAINEGFSSLKQSFSGTYSPKTFGYYGSPRDARTSESTANLRQSPTVVIDLNKELNSSIPRLENAIEITKNTLAYIRMIPQVTSDLDICTPGPDIKWETRINDYYEKSTKGLQKTSSKDNTNGEEAELILSQMDVQFDLSIQETTLMINDPYRNIPGVAESSLLIESMTQRTAQFSQLFDQLINYQTTLNTLRNVKGNIQSSVVGYQYPTGSLDEISSSDRGIIQGIGKLVLFDDDWEGVRSITQAQKDALYRASLIAIPRTEDLPTDDPATVINERDIEIKKRVFEYQWELWDAYMFETEQRQSDRQKMFVQFNELKEDLPNETFVTRAILQQEEIKEDILMVGQAVNDCLLVRGIFVAALYPGSPFGMGVIASNSLPQIDYRLDTKRIILEVNETPIRIAISDVSAIIGNNAPARRLAIRNYQLAELQDLIEAVANAIPTKTTRLRQIFQKPSILSVTPEMIDDWQKTNTLGDTYQTTITVPSVPPIIVGQGITIEHILKSDTQGVLFCTLPLKNFKDDPSVKRWEQMSCNPIDNDINKVAVIKYTQNVKDKVDRKKTTDIIADGGANPLRDTRKVFMEVPGNWYFSTGANDYIRFNLGN